MVDTNLVRSDAFVDSYLVGCFSQEQIHQPSALHWVGACHRGYDHKQVSSYKTDWLNPCKLCIINSPKSCTTSSLSDRDEA